MSSPFRLKKAESQSLLAIRTLSSRGALAHTLETSFDFVWRWLNQRESVTVGPAIAVYFAVDDDVLDVAAGFPVAEAIEPEGRIERIELAMGEVATALHHGAYVELPAVHQRLDEWIESQSLRVVGPRFEIYWVDPGQAKNESELRTEVVVPVSR